MGEDGRPGRRDHPHGHVPVELIGDGRGRHAEQQQRPPLSAEAKRRCSE
jgi:hypothetical protein